MAVDRYQTLTNYRHPQDSNLLDVHRAMTYNSMGEPVLRTTSGAAATANDAFGRLRVSNPYSLFDSFHRYQDNGKITQYTTGSGASVHNTASTTILMSVGTDTNAAIYRESSRVFTYQPGKSLQILQTFCFGDDHGQRQRIGYFDTQNGMFLERSNGTIYLVRRTSSYGTTQEHRVAQADWNIDPLDGTGRSTKVLHIDRSQILFTDIEWLGVGSVRMGFVIGGEFVQAHQFNHSNEIDPITGVGLNTTYMGTACLPVRAELQNTTATTTSSTLRIICTNINSEGGIEVRGRPKSAGHLLSAPKNLANKDVSYPVLSIRLRSDRMGAIVTPRNFSISAGGNVNYRYSLQIGAITTGGSWISEPNSSVEYNLNPTALTTGTIVETGYIIGSNQSSTSPSLADTPFKYQLERNTFTGDRYEFVITATASANDSAVYASVNWEEIT